MITVSYRTILRVLIKKWPLCHFHIFVFPYLIWKKLRKKAQLVESFYSVKYGLSIITSNVFQIISVMKTKTLVFPEKWFFKNSSFWHLNSFFDLKNLFQITEKMNWKSTIICQNNWLYIIWRSRRTRLLSFLIFEFGTRYEINLNLIFILYQSIT